MSLRPGSFPWLVAHDLRLQWRSFGDLLAKLNGKTAWLVVAAALVAVHLVAIPAVAAFRPFLHGTGTAGGNDDGQVVIGVLVAFILPWLMSQGLLGGTRLLFDRGDLDLLLGSPMPARAVFASRAIAIASSAIGSVAILLFPLADTGALLDGPAWLAIYPVLMAAGLFGTAIGLSLAMGLFFAIGPRYARAIAQLSAAAIAGAFVLGPQIVALLPAAMRDAVFAAIFGQSGTKALDLGGAVSMALAATRGDPAAICVMVLSSSITFALTVLLLGRIFAVASYRASGASSDPRAGSVDRRPLRFSTGVGASLRRKEWRLLLRDPNLFAQISLQTIYTVPIAIVLLRSDGGLPVALAVAPTLVVVATQIAASLAWITVSGEDAPELIAAAPVVRSDVERHKLSAIALPVLAIIAVPVFGLAFVSIRSAFLALVFALGGAASTALLNLWHPMPGKRRGMLRRHSQSKLIGLVEHGLALAWAVGIVLALIGSFACLIPLAAAVGVLAMFRPGRKLSQLRSIAAPAVEAAV